MLSAQTATLAATTLVAVALAFYLLSKSSPEDLPESVPPVERVPIAAAPPEAVRTKSMSYAPRSAAAPTEPPSRNGQAAPSKPAVPKKKKSEGEEDGGRKRSKAAEAKAAAVKAAEAEESKGEPFVNSVVSRAILKQPVDLLALANPPAKESKSKLDGKGKLGDKGERRKAKARPISSWGESFQLAMQTLEGSAVDAALRAQQQLTGCLVQASKPGAPTDALVITLRGLGFVYASMGQLDRAEAAYSKARTEAAKRRLDSLSSLGCWRDLAVLSREQGEHAKAEACWGEARRTLLGMQAAAQGGKGDGKGELGGPKETRAAAEQQAAAERVELQLCLADCLRCQGRFDESEASMAEGWAWRKQHLGPDQADTVGAAYDVSRVRRARAFAAAMAAPTAAAAAAAAEPNEVPEAAARAEGEAATAAEAEVSGDVVAAGEGGGDAASAAAAAATSAALSSRVAGALDAMQTAAADLDASWMAGLQQLCTEGGEAAHKWAEHVNMIASVAQLHKDWAEASLLFRLANPVLKQLHAEEGLEYAELLNSEGECLLELKCHHLAAPLFDLAHTAVATAQGSDDASVASIEANQAAVLSASGQGQRAEVLFAAALERIRTSAVALEEEEAAQQGQQQGQGGEGRAEEQSNLFMVQARHATPSPPP